MNSSTYRACVVYSLLILVSGCQRRHPLSLLPRSPLPQLMGERCSIQKRTYDHHHHRITVRAKFCCLYGSYHAMASSIPSGLLFSCPIQLAIINESCDPLVLDPVYFSTPITPLETIYEQIRLQITTETGCCSSLAPCSFCIARQRWLPVDRSSACRWYAETVQSLGQIALTQSVLILPGATVERIIFPCWNSDDMGQQLQFWMRQLSSGHYVPVTLDWT